MVHLQTHIEKRMQDQVVVDTAGTGGRIVASVLETWPGDTRKLTWQPSAQ